MAITKERAREIITKLCKGTRLGKLAAYLHLYVKADDLQNIDSGWDDEAVVGYIEEMYNMAVRIGAVAGSSATAAGGEGGAGPTGAGAITTGWNGGWGLGSIGPVPLFAATSAPQPNVVQPGAGAFATRWNNVWGPSPVGPGPFAGALATMYNDGRGSGPSSAFVTDSQQRFQDDITSVIDADVKNVFSLEFEIYNDPGAIHEISQELQSDWYTRNFGVPVYFKGKVLSAKTEKWIVASTSNGAVQAFVTWLHRKYGRSRRPPDGDELKAIFMPKENIGYNNRADAVDMVTRAVQELGLGPPRTQLASRRAEEVAQQKERGASLGHGGSQPVSGGLSRSSSSRAEE